MCKKIAIFFAIFSLEDARGASYSLRAPHNATSVIGDPAEFRGENTRIWFGINGQRKETFLGNESTFLGRETTFLGSNIKKSAFLEAGSWVGVFSVFSRSSLGVLRQGIREGKRTAILIKSTFWWLGVLRFILGSSLVRTWSLTVRIYIRYKGR